mmetsp:Transcript_27583/g.67086  ORF Transcript_27583/g.67086 Transcript_27583/m.67086 type:complete len:734 (+) Transcript_27583:136-2337(+)
MQSTLAAHVDQFLYIPESSDTSSEEAPFDCPMNNKQQPGQNKTVSSSSSTPIKKDKIDSEYSYEDGPSFDCDGPPPNMENGVKVDFGLATNAIGITPIKSNKTNYSAPGDDATVMTEPVTPSPFKTPSSVNKYSSSSSTRRGRQIYNNEDTPFDEMPFDESSPRDNAAAAARSSTVSVLQQMEMEPAAGALPARKGSKLSLPPRPNRRRKDDLNGGSAHSASTCEDEADADVLLDYEADVEPPQAKGFGEYPYSDDDDTIGTAASENASVPTVRRRNNRDIILTDMNRSNKPGIEEWCLSNVFDNIATDAALDVADWFTDGYKEGKKNVKTIVYDCLVPLKEKEGGGYAEDGEEMVQLLSATAEKSDLRLTEEKKPKRAQKKVSKKGRKFKSSMDDIDDDDEECNYSTLPRSKKKVGSVQKKAPKKERRKFRRSTMDNIDDDNEDESNYSTFRSKNTADYSAKTPTERSNLATPTVLTRTRSLLEDTPTKDTSHFIQQHSATDENDQAMAAGPILESHSFDSTSTTKTDNYSVHQENKSDDDDDEDNSSDKEDETPQTVPEDDDSVLDQAAEMAALVGTNKPSMSPAAPEKQPSEDLGSEEAATAEKKKQDEEPRQFKMPMAAHKLTMAKAKEVLKAAKSNGGMQSHPLMFLEMEPESKYADTTPLPKAKEWPPKKKTTPAPNPSATNTTTSYKPPSARKSKPVDRFGYAAALKDKSNTTTKQEGGGATEEWW